MIDQSKLEAEQIERIRVLCAEQAGFTRIKDDPRLGINNCKMAWLSPNDEFCFFSTLPNYPGDLNAAAELRALLNQAGQWMFCVHLRDQFNFLPGKARDFYFANATALQTCIAFLTTRGVKWE
jgi:hypothetical protein